MTQGEGLTDKQNFDPTTGLWKGMHMDIKYVRIYQDDSQGETRGLNPPITFETRRKLLKNRVTCNLLPELRCLVKANGGEEGPDKMAKVACDKLRELGDDYCDTIPHLCSLNNAGNKEGVYGLNNVTVANMANQHLSLVHGVCCVDQSKEADPKSGSPLWEKAVCRDTPLTRLPDWIRESEYFKDPPVVRRRVPRRDWSGWLCFCGGFCLWLGHGGVQSPAAAKALGAPRAQLPRVASPLAARLLPARLPAAHCCPRIAPTPSTAARRARRGRLSGSRAPTLQDGRPSAVAFRRRRRRRRRLPEQMKAVRGEGMRRSELIDCHTCDYGDSAHGVRKPCHLCMRCDRCDRA